MSPRKRQMEEQFIGLVVRRLAIVSRHGDMDAFRYHFPFEQLKSLKNLVCNNNRIRPRPLGK